jgi:hypothetical protein
MALDHGILNTPLKSRGNIDRDIDRFKAEQRKIAKEQAKAQRVLIAEAKALVAALTDDQFKAISEKFKVDEKRCREVLKNMITQRPAVLIDYLTPKG